MLVRLLIYGFLFYMVYKFFGNVFRNLFPDDKAEPKRAADQKGKIDLSHYDVEDADFEDIND